MSILKDHSARLDLSRSVWFSMTRLGHVMLDLDNFVHFPIIFQLACEVLKQIILKARQFISVLEEWLGSTIAIL